MEMIMAVLFCFGFAGAKQARAGTAVPCPYNSPSRHGDSVASRDDPQNKKPTRLRVGWNFFFVAATTNSPLASYLGGTQNRNQYE
jgi:hypothetical protein